MTGITPGNLRAGTGPGPNPKKGKSAAEIWANAPPAAKREYARQMAKARRTNPDPFALGPPGHMTIGRLQNASPQAVKTVQRQLRAKGYNVGNVDGVAGPRTKRMLGYYEIGVAPRKIAAVQARTQDNEASMHHGHPQGTPSVPHPNADPKSHGAPKPKAAAPKAAKTHLNFGNISGGGNLQYISPKMAGSQADMQYGPQIADLMSQLKQGKLQGAQDIHDIGHWYGMVQDALQRARGHTQAQGSHALSEDQAVTQGILASLGGSANAASEGVAAQGLRGAQAQEGLNSIEQQYLNDTAPLVEQVSAGAKARQVAMENQLQAGLGGKLNAVYGQRGAATADNLMKIIQYNNQLRQQGFTNKLSAAQTAAAAAMTGAQIAGLNAQTKTAASKTSGFTPWAKLNPVDRQKLIDMSMQGIVDPNHGGAMLPGTSMGDAWGHVRQYLLSNGYSNAKYTGSGELAPPPKNAVSRQMRGLILNALHSAQNAASYNHTQGVQGY